MTMEAGTEGPQAKECQRLAAPRSRERQRKNSPLQAPQEHSPANTLISRFLASRTVRE